MAIPTDGLVFYAPLAEDKATAETGQTLTKTGTIEFTTQDKIQCALFDGNSIIKALDENLPTGSSPRSISVWAKSTDTSLDSYIFGFGNRSTNQMFAINFYFDDLAIGCMNNNFETTGKIKQYEWHHYIASASGNEVSIYVDGVLQHTGIFPQGMNTVSSIIFIGASTDNGTSGINYEFKGFLASARIYNRILSKEEVTSLYNEFNEDAGGGDSGNTGFLIDGLFLSSSKPKLGQKGLLLDNKYFLPLVEGSGGSAEYYKCASVDTSTKTWTGYRAVLNEGVYTFENTVTSGLSYTSVTPQAGKIYSQDALVYGANLYQGIPTDGLVFYAPLYEKKTTAETGQIMSHGGSYSYETYQDVPSIVLNKGYVNVDDVSTLKPLGSVFTLCFWSNTSSDEDITVFAVRDSIITYWDTCCINGEYYLVEDRVKGKWYFSAYVQNGSTGQGYVNGIKLSSEYNSILNLNSATRLVIGARQDDSFAWVGALSSFRIYNRALSDKEISLLATEFNI